MVTTKPAASKTVNLNGKGKEEVKPNQENQGKPKEETEAKPQAEVKMLPIITAEKREPVTLPTLQARLKKLAELQNLVDRRENLTEALDNVNAFDCKTPNAAPVIRFTNSKGAGFQISHSGVIADVIELLEAKLKLQVEEVESKIAFTF